MHDHPARPSFQVHPGLLLAATLTLLSPRVARAEDSVTFKAQSWQEDGKRIRVDSQYALVETDITADAHLKVMGLIDSIARLGTPISPTNSRA